MVKPVCESAYSLCVMRLFGDAVNDGVQTQQGLTISHTVVVIVGLSE